MDTTHWIPLTVALAVTTVTADFAELRLISHLENGRSIFMSGTTSYGRVIQNSHGMEGVGCVMCHGPDGRGGTMHGIAAPNITFRFLSDPRGYEHVTGRRRPAHNEETIKAAIVAGIDSAGNTLHAEMPRWTGLNSQDLDDLLGFLKSLQPASGGMPRGPEGL